MHFLFFYHYHCYYFTINISAVLRNLSLKLKIIETFFLFIILFYGRRLRVIFQILIYLSVYRLYWIHKAVQLGTLIIILRVLLLRNSAARGAFFSLLSIVLRICRLIVWRLRTGPVDDRDQRNAKWPLSNSHHLKVRFVLRPRCSASSTTKRNLHTHRLAFSMLVTVDE